MKTLILVALDLYRLLARPLLPQACRFYPSCGDYAYEAFSRHGVLHAVRLTGLRLVRCHPLNPGGFDAVPSPHQ